MSNVQTVAVLVVMKPLAEKNFPEQALMNQKGVTWLDDGRIPYKSKKDIEGTAVGHKGSPLPVAYGWNQHSMEQPEEGFTPNQKGRFPANLLVSDKVLDTGTAKKANPSLRSGKSGKSAFFGSSKRSLYIIERLDDIRDERDKKTFSRYFSLDAWWATLQTKKKLDKKQEVKVMNQKEWQKKFTNQVVEGDCTQLLKELPNKSIDLLVTDPPYGIKFMGKSWDQAVPSIRIWKECLRVLKPGSFAFVMCSPRLDVMSEMGKRLMEAGFETGFTPIFWTFASGFPKAQNISKAVDKHTRRDYIIAAKKLGLNIPNNSFWDWTKGEHSPSDKWWNKFKELLPEKDWKQIEREVIGIDPQKGNIGYEKENYSFKPKTRYITKSATPQAKALDGSYGGFQPKPAVELILVAMKPLAEKTFPEQALMNQKGVTWLDEGRIPLDINDPNMRLNAKEHNVTTKGGFSDSYHKHSTQKIDRTDMAGELGFHNKQGRFPANLLVSDNVLDDGTITKSEGGKTERKDTTHFGRITNLDKSKYFNYGDSGGFSRYFSLDAWWTEQIKQLPAKVQKTFPFLIVPKASKSEKNRGLDFNPIDNTDKYNGKFPQSKADRTNENKHPTVKPIQLMSYLVTIGSREGDLVLDPFAGTGTTGIACQLLFRDFMLLEIDPDYCKIARARLQSYTNQKTLFDFGKKKEE